MPRWLWVPVVLLGACATTATGDVPGGADAAIDPAADADNELQGADAAADAPFDAAVVDAGPPDSVPLPDAAPPVLTTIAPSPILVARGATVSVTVSIDKPAADGGVLVALSSTTAGAATIPANVTIPAGATSVSFDVVGVSVGGPYNLGASIPGGLVLAPLSIAPALQSISASASDVTVGTSAPYSVTLETATPFPLDVALMSGVPSAASVPVKVTIPTGASSASFAVTGSALAAPVKLTASLGGLAVHTNARVVGVYLSEILYDVTSNDTTLEWVELYNAASVAVDLSGVQLQSAGGGSGTNYTTSLGLAGTLQPGQCAVVGGPANAGITFFQGMDLMPDLGNASSGKADGIRLATSGGGVIDDVIYGAANTDMIVDENDVVVPPDVAAAAVNQTIERTAPGMNGAWQVQATPSPGDCTPISQ